LLLVACCALPALADGQPVPFSFPFPPDARVRSVVIPGGPGEDLAHPVIVDSLPFNGSGVTCDFAHDVDGTCGLFGPDQVYAFSPSRDMNVRILASAGAKWVLIGIYANTLDNWSCFKFAPGPPPLFLPEYFMTAGNTYYIVAEVTEDLVSSACGGYGIQLSEGPRRCESCPAGAIFEGEAICFNRYLDRYNAGCDARSAAQFPYKFTPVTCGSTPVSICGNYGDYRDEFGDFVYESDWYRIVLDRPGRLEAELVGDLPGTVAVWRSDENPYACMNMVEVCASTAGSPCNRVGCESPVTPGIYYVRVREVRAGDPFGCGWNYAMTLTYSDVITSTRRATWGQVKAVYR
jgi:hypothetical protein